MKQEYVTVVPSSTQMYSGVGFAMFNWIEFSREYFEHTIITDVQNQENHSLIKDFCVRYNLNLIEVPGVNIAGLLDIYLMNLDLIKEFNEAKFIETVSWANSSSNFAVLKNIRKNQTLIFTPHWQPNNTVPEGSDFGVMDQIFQSFINRSDIVFVDSDVEARVISNKLAAPEKIHVNYIGIKNPRENQAPSNDSGKYYIAIGDWREKRKRPENLIQIFNEYVQKHGKKDLIIIGKDSETIKIPKSLKPRIKTYGYVDDTVKINLLQNAYAYVSTSEYEAFSLPVSEALSYGVPVILNETKVLRSIYDGLCGVSFIKASEPSNSVKEMFIIEKSIIEKEKIYIDWLNALSPHKLHNSKYQTIITEFIK